MLSLKVILRQKSKLDRTKKYYNETGSQLTLMLGMIKDNLDTAVRASKKGITEFKPALPVLNPNAEIVALEMTDRPAALLTDQGSKNKNEDTALAKVSKGELAAVSDAPKKEKISYKDLSISVIEEQYDETMRELYASVGQEYHEETAKNEAEID